MAKAKWSSFKKRIAISVQIEGLFFADEQKSLMKQRFLWMASVLVKKVAGMLEQWLMETIPAMTALQ